MVDEMPEAEEPKGDKRKSGTSGSVFLIRGMASVMLILSFLIYVALIADTSADSYMIGLVILIIGLGLGFACIWMGNIKVFKPEGLSLITLNLVLLLISIIFLIAGAVLLGTKIDTTKDIPISNLIWVLLYAFFTLSFVELSHSNYRFTDIDSYARTHELKGFNVGTVVNNYFMWFGILMGAIITLTFLILATHYGLIIAVTSANKVFGSSVELNSIYIFAIAIALWFIPLGILAAVIFGEGSLIKSTRTILVKTEKAPGEEFLGLQAVEKPEDLAKK